MPSIVNPREARGGAWTEVCDTASEWQTALRPEAARSLAARRVPDDIVSRFSPERYTAEFRAFAAS